MTVPVSAGLEKSGASDTQTDRGLWLRRYSAAAGGAAAAVPRLVCCPHSGGAASYFLPLSAQLSPTVQVVAVQYPGRQDRRAEPLVGDLRELAARIGDALADEPDPLALFGHSMGALLAFEVARRLERDGRALTALFVSGYRAPDIDKNTLMHRAGDAELLRDLRSLGGTELGLLDDDEIVQLVLPVIRNDYRVAETYRYEAGNEPELSCPIVALIGGEDPKVTEAEAGRWRRHTSGEFELLVFPGGHFYLNSFSAELADLVSARLATGRLR